MAYSHIHYAMKRLTPIFTIQRNGLLPYLVFNETAYSHIHNSMKRLTPIFTIQRNGLLPYSLFNETAYSHIHYSTKRLTPIFTIQWNGLLPYPQFNETAYSDIHYSNPNRVFNRVDLRGDEPYYMNFLAYVFNWKHDFYALFLKDNENLSASCYF